MDNSNRLVGSMLTMQEVSKLPHVHSSTLRRWTDRRVPKVYRIGPRGDRRFRAENGALFLLEDNKGIRFDMQMVLGR